MLPARPGFDSSMARLSLLIIFGGSGYPLLCAQVMHDFQEFGVRYLAVALARTRWAARRVARQWIGRALLDGGRMHRGGVIPQVLAIAPFALRDLLSVDRDVARRLDADADLRSVHRHDGYFNIIADA
jgi:hypothetical protein